MRKSLLLLLGVFLLPLSSGVVFAQDFRSGFPVGLVVDGSRFLGFVTAYVESSGDIPTQSTSIDGSVYVNKSGPRMGAERNPYRSSIPLSGDLITLQVGMGMARELYHWIDSSFTGKSIFKSGELITCDSQYQCQARIQFSNAIVTEVTIPALDGSSQDPGNMTVRIGSERTVQVRGQARQLKSSLKPIKWMTSNFKFNLGDMPTEHVMKIDSFTWKKGAEGTDLKITMPMISWVRWRQYADVQFQTNATGVPMELNGRIEFLSGDLRETLAHIDLFNVGLSSLKAGSSVANAEKIQTFKVTLHAKEMRLYHP